MRKTTRQGNSPIRFLVLIPILAMGVLGIAFTLFWIFMASSIGAPAFFRLFGVGFLIVLVTIIATMIVAVVRGEGSAAQLYEDEDRASLYQADQRFVERNEVRARSVKCTYCGTRVDEDNRRCPNCGANI